MVDGEVQMTLDTNQIGMIVTAALVLGGVIVKLTPTKKDDQWWEAIKSAVGKGSK